MSISEKLIKARLGILALADELINISLTCKRAGISRNYFYDINEAMEKYDPDGLAPPQLGSPRMPNQTPEIERQILKMTAQFSTCKYLRISGRLRLTGRGVPHSTIRAAWQRHGFTLENERLLWLAQRTAAEGGVFSERLIELLQKC